MRKKISLQDAIDFVTDENISDLSEFSFDESDVDINMLPKISIEESENSDTDDDIPLSAIVSFSTDNNEGNPEPTIIGGAKKTPLLVSVNSEKNF